MCSCAVRRSCLPIGSGGRIRPHSCRTTAQMENQHVAVRLDGQRGRENDLPFCNDSTVADDTSDTWGSTSHAPCNVSA